MKSRVKAGVVGMTSVDKGLYIRIAESGIAFWVFRYSANSNRWPEPMRKETYQLISQGCLMLCPPICQSQRTPPISEFDESRWWYF
jgi:hypothetical protein